MTLLSKQDVAKMLKCSVSKVEKMMAKGEIDYRKIGSLVRFHPDAVVKITGAPLSPEVVPAHTEKHEVVEMMTLYGPVRGRR